MSTSLKVSVFLSGLIAFVLSSPAQASVTTQCQVQPREGQLSPLAMRALFTLESTTDGNVTATYTNLPTPVGAGQAITIEQTRKMIFYKSTIPAVRQQLLSDPKFFNELIGSPEPQGFKPFNDLLVCKTVGATAPQPSTPQPGSTIADLVDSAYRYWNGKPSMNVTDKQLLETEAYTFLFEKTGNRIVGYFARPNDDSMCITGTVTGNMIKGVVNPPPRFANPASRQNKAFDPAGFMKLGAWSNRGNLGMFNPSTLDLSKFNRINIGPRRAPSICR
ncbi:MAG: hypothetical protein MUC48_17245 [Leptolyngbya sp. Prado105]|nr:hypothetical protein [Leptolyngbya sp. Prado105]